MGGILLLLACDDDGDFDDHSDLDEGVLACEEAFARLERCCGYDIEDLESYGVRGRCIDRRYQETTHGCEGRSSFSAGTDKPALTLDESKCIRNRSCVVLRAAGICERARNVAARGHQSWSSTDPSRSPSTESGETSYEHPPVCP